MTSYHVIKSNWLTQAPHPRAYTVTWALTALLVLGTALFLSGIAEAWMPASPHLVLEQKQAWRLWTSLLAHGDLAHLLSNLLLFIPLCFVLSGYFGPFFFPVVGWLIGGAVNFLVLQTLPSATMLIGVSGAVYWMGGAWLTLYALIDRRDSVRRRFAKVAIFSLVLFFPQSFQPEVSYLSHLLGFISGILSGAAYYRLKRARFLQAEVTEEIFEDEFPEELKSNALTDLD